MLRGRAMTIASALAVAAGLAVVALSRPPAERMEHRRRSGTEVRGICTKVVEATFNPRTQRGLKIAKAAFRFTYRIDPYDRELIRERIENDWDRVVSASLKELIQRTPGELKHEAGLDSLDNDLCDAIGEVVFPDGDGRVEEILWQQVVVQ